MSLSLDRIMKVLYDQKIIPVDDPIIKFACKTLEVAAEKRLGAIDVSIQGSYSLDDNYEPLWEMSASLSFPVLPCAKIEYEIRRRDSDQGITKIWCGPNHEPASDDAIEGYLDWISTANDGSR